MIVAAVVVINPLGQDIIYAAFFSGEQLARNIWQPIAFGAGAILMVLAALEWWIRKRRAA
jgi:hypothetical protein